MVKEIWKDNEKEICQSKIIFPVGVKRWHGAAKDSWFSHLAIEVSGENSST